MRNPGLVWEFYSWRRDVAAACRPNRAHYAIAALERRLEQQGRRLTLISQNVDRFHQQAGSRNVVELHGRCVRGELHRAGPFQGPQVLATAPRQVVTLD